MAALEMTTTRSAIKTPRRFHIFMCRTSAVEPSEPSEPSEPVEPAEPISYVIKGRSAPWANPEP